MGDSYRTVVISDLHLAGPVDDRECATAFAAFVRERSEASPAPGMRWRLVVAGDLFDFEIRRGRATGTWNAAAEIDALIRDFPDVWAELRTFVADGNELVLVAGNHDWEVALPLVAARVRREIGDGTTVRTVWHDAKRGLLIAHGHQFDPDNRFCNWPPRPDATEQVPIGVLLTRWFAGPLRFRPVMHVDRPPLFSLLSVFRDYGLRAPLIIFGYYRAALRIVLHARRVTARPEFGADDGSAEAVLSRLAVLSTISNVADTFHRLYLGRSLVTFFAAVAVALTLWLAPLSWAAWLVLVEILVPMGVFAQLGNRFGGRAVRMLEDGARRVAETGIARTVVFGHVHRIAVIALGNDGRYLNAGSFLTGPPGQRTIHYVVEESRGFRLVAAPVFRSADPASASAFSAGA